MLGLLVASCEVNAAEQDVNRALGQVLTIHENRIMRYLLANLQTTTKKRLLWLIKRLCSNQISRSFKAFEENVSMDIFC